MASQEMTEALTEQALRAKRLNDWMNKANLTKEEAAAVFVLRLDAAYQAFRANPSGDQWATLECLMYDYQHVRKNIGR